MGIKIANLSEILNAVHPDTILNPGELAIQSVACHPSTVKGPGCLFVCMDEYLEYNRWQTWRTHLEELPRSGVAAVVAPEPIQGLQVPQFITAHPRRALGRLARFLNDFPDLYMQVFGVTGTNGKTTTSRMLAHMYSQLGQPCGSIGTLGLKLDARLEIPGAYTTPLASELYAELAQLREAGAAAVAMEVSSHGLALDRVEGMAFEAAILTNVERDHLDFHGTAEAYAEAKGRLFERVRQSGWCVLNHHSPEAPVYRKRASGTVVTYGLAGSGADLELIRHELQPTHSGFTLRFREEEWDFRMRLVGMFQIENAMAAIALLAVKGWSGPEIARALEDFPPVCGRMERFSLPNGGTAIVDYAHNPDGLKHLLENCRLLCRGKLQVVFGCGGDRDKGKRPMMGRLARDLADICWVTSDNPRTEDPEAIIIDILAGMDGEGSGIHRIADRRAAIESAFAETGPGDVLVVAGKGHEDYQIIGYTRHPFSDQGILRGLGAS